MEKQIISGFPFIGDRKWMVYTGESHENGHVTIWFMVDIDIDIDIANGC